ncbi:hypothetical protein P4S64_09245 [Vibrio sp. M60_M31a]
MKDSSVAMDAAGIVSLLLAQSDTDKADSYYQQYVDKHLITRNEVKIWLAQWKYDQGNLEESQLLAKSCSSKQCERLVLDIEETLFEQQAESAGISPLTFDEKDDGSKNDETKILRTDNTIEPNCHDAKVTPTTRSRS